MARVKDAVSLADRVAQDEDARHELVGGQLVAAEGTDWVHEEPSPGSSPCFTPGLSRAAAGSRHSGVRFALASDRARMPDLSVFLPGRPRPPRRGLVRVPPDIASEVVSPATGSADA